MLKEIDLMAMLALIVKAYPTPPADEVGNSQDYLQLQTFGVMGRTLDTSFFNPDTIGADIKRYQYKDHFYSRAWEQDQNGKIKIDYPTLTYHSLSEVANLRLKNGRLSFQLVVSDLYDRKITGQDMQAVRYQRTREEVLEQLKTFTKTVIAELRTFARISYYANSAPTVPLIGWLPKSLYESAAFKVIYTVTAVLEQLERRFVNVEQVEMAEFQDSSYQGLPHYVATLSILLDDCPPFIPANDYLRAISTVAAQTPTT